MTDVNSNNAKGAGAHTIGLIYQCQVIPLGMNEFKVDIVMTLTVPACGMGPVLMAEIEEKVRLIKNVTDG